MSAYDYKRLFTDVTCEFCQPTNFVRQDEVHLQATSYTPRWWTKALLAIQRRKPLLMFHLYLNATPDLSQPRLASTAAAMFQRNDVFRATRVRRNVAKTKYILPLFW